MSFWLSFRFKRYLDWRLEAVSPKDKKTAEGEKSCYFYAFRSNKGFFSNNKYNKKACKLKQGELQENKKRGMTLKKYVQWRVCWLSKYTFFYFKKGEKRKLFLHKKGQTLYRHHVQYTCREVGVHVCIYRTEG